jgi:hypothetical protein
MPVFVSALTSGKFGRVHVTELPELLELDDDELLLDEEELLLDDEELLLEEEELLDDELLDDRPLDPWPPQPTRLTIIAAK